MRIAWLRTFLALAVVCLPGGAAHADPELATYLCSGTVPADALTEASLTTTGFTISCSGDETALEGSGPPPSFSASGTLHITNTFVAPGIYETSGQASFTVGTEDWKVYFGDSRMSIGGIMPFGESHSPNVIFDNGDYLGPSAALEERYHIHQGEIRDIPCDQVVSPCFEVHDFQFTAEWLHDLPVA